MDADNNVGEVALDAACQDPASRTSGIASCSRFAPWKISFSGACLTTRRRLGFADPR